MITKDNVVVTVDAIVYFEATDPVNLVYTVVNFYGAATKLAQTNNAIKAAEPDERLIAIQYLEALKVIANGDVSKVFIPYEATGVLGAVGGGRERFHGGNGRSPNGPEAGATPTPISPR